MTSEPPASDSSAPALRLGTRGSALALAQSGQVARALETAHPGLRVELVPIVTRGDRLPGDLAAFGGKGLFTEELERGLLDGSLDLAVHSLKDLPVALPAGLTVAAHPPRADPRDVLVSAVAASLDGLPPGAVVLTGSLRRRALILLRRPDLRVEPLRGNVDTRLRRWRESGAAAVVLAGAGLVRLGLLAQEELSAYGLALASDPLTQQLGEVSGTPSVAGQPRPGVPVDGAPPPEARPRELPAYPLPPEVLLPAPGQGTLALEVRTGGRAERLCRALDDLPTAAAAAAERRVVAAFGGDCTLPLAAWARWEGGRQLLRLTALIATPDGRHAARGEAAGSSPAEVAAACIAALHADGAEAVLARVRAEPAASGNGVPGGGAADGDG
jgi:hydroxymethylbilane synthase